MPIRHRAQRAPDRMTVAVRTPRVAILSCAIAMAVSCAFPLHAGTLYKCLGADGVTAYVSKRIEGAKCTVTARFDDTPASTPVAQASDDKARAPARPAFEPAPSANNTGASAALATVQDFGDPNAAAVAAKLRQPNGDFRYVQIGDSHTAGEFFTDALRTKLQARLGDGGIGWAMPMRVPGQRMARVTFEHEGWSLVSSRKSGVADYPFGGLIAQVDSDHAVLTVNPRQGSASQRVTAIIRQAPDSAALVVTDADGQQQSVRSPAADGLWHRVTFVARLPMTVVADRSRGTAIGGWWFSGTEPGATVSAVGINGSEQVQWDRWRSDWMQDLAPAQPDVIAIAYGTNEAFDKTLDESAMRASLSKAVDQLRQRFPQAAILILGAPESLSAQGGACGVRAPSLDAAQRIQKDVAAGKKTLFWDWQQSMGGACSMKRWIGDGWARADGVHFSALGYGRLGDALYQGLMDLAASNSSR